MVAGGACIGCTMPGFPDKFSPFYKAPPRVARFGRHHPRLRLGDPPAAPRDDAQPQPGAVWDQGGAVPSPYASEQPAPSLSASLEGFFYCKLQYRGSVDQRKRNKKQPNPRSMNIYRHRRARQREDASQAGRRAVRRRVSD